MSEARVSGGRRRDPTVDARAMAAALELVAGPGIEATTMDAIALRSGVSKAALYRRWPSKEPLIVDAIVDSGWNSIDPDAPSSGNLRDDLVRIVGAETARATGEKSRVLAGVLSVIGQDPALRAAIMNAIIEPRAVAIVRALREATARGDIPAGGHPDTLGAVLPALLVYRLIVQGLPVTRRWQYEIVDEILLPAAGGGGR